MFVITISIFLLVPEKVPQLTATGTTTRLNVIWTVPRGQVSSYSIRLFKNNVLVSNKTAPNSSTYELFEGLDPGVLYQVQLVTISGPVQSNSNTVSNATCELGLLTGGYSNTTCTFTISVFVPL